MAIAVEIKSELIRLLNYLDGHAGDSASRVHRKGKIGAKTSSCPATEGLKCIMVSLGSLKNLD